LADALLRKRNEDRLKTLMLIGAVTGFCLGIATGLAVGTDWPTTLWRACAAAAALGWLMRWWGRVWLRGLQVAIYERRLAEAASRQQSEPAIPLKK
jgi:hypothetical protein